MSNNFYQNMAKEIANSNPINANPLQENAAVNTAYDNSSSLSDMEREYKMIGQRYKELNPVPQVSEEDKKLYKEIDAKDGENITFWNLLDFYNWRKRLSSANEYAGKQMELSHLNTLWFQKKITNEQQTRRQELQKELEAYQRVTDKYGTVESMFTRGALNLGHQVWDYTVGGAEKGVKYTEAGLALAGAAAATGVGAPASLGVAGATAAYGFAAGSAEYAWEQGSADIFAALMEQKDVNGNVIDEDTARTLASIGGVGSAALEMAGSILGIKTVAPGISKAMTGKISSALQSKGVQKILGNSATKKISKNLGLQTFAQTAKNYALGTGGEIATELGQEVLTFGVEELGRAIQGGVYSDAHGYNELMDRLKDTAYETFITVGGVYGLGAGRSGISHYVKSRKERQEINTLVQAAQNPEVKKYPYLVKSMMQQAFDKGYNKDKRYTYFPAEDFATTLFQTDEGIQLAHEMGITPESVQEAIQLDMPVCVETEKAAAFLYSNDKYKHLADNAKFNPNLMSTAEIAEYEKQGQDFIQRAEQAEKLADEAVSLATEDMDKSELDILADSKVEELMQAGYTEREATAYARLWAAMSQRFASAYQETPQEHINRIKIEEKQNYDGTVSKRFTLDKRQIYGQPVNNDVNVDAPVEVVAIEPRFTGKIAKVLRKRFPEDLKEQVLTAFKNGIVNEDTGKIISMSSNDFKEHMKFGDEDAVDGLLQLEAVMALPELMQKAKLVETYKDKYGIPEIKQMHRFQGALRIGNKDYSVKLTVKEFKDGTLRLDDKNPFKIYHHRLEKELSASNSLDNSGKGEPVENSLKPLADSSNTYTLRKLIEDVKDSEGNPFINPDGTVNYKQKGDTSNTLYQLAYHGTPHNFDTFSLDSIGTGEGAQAHGWGLYFAKDKKTSDGYREVLTATNKKRNRYAPIYYDMLENGIVIDEKLKNSIWGNLGIDAIDLGNPKQKEALINNIKNSLNLSASEIQKNEIKINKIKSAIEIIEKNPKMSISAFKESPEGKEVVNGMLYSLFSFAKIRAENENRKQNINDIKYILGDYLEYATTKYNAEQEYFNAVSKLNLEQLELKEKENNGQLFEVDIPENDMLLDEDKKFFEQPKKVREALKKLIKDKNLESEFNIQTTEDFADKIKSLYGDKAKKIVLDIISAERENNEEKITAAWDEWNSFEKENNIDRNEFDINSVYDAIRGENFTGKEFYRRLAGIYDSDKFVSELLNEYGIKGITYDGRRDGRCFVVFDDKAISVLEKYYQEQRNNSSPRGLIRFNPKTQEAMITVFKDKKDFSTVLHETSHYFLHTLANAYQMENAPAWVKENFETLAREMGFDPNKPLSTETHERFARLGEAYFREGKAPREELAGAFNMFKGWLTSLYRYVSKLLGKDSLNDEIRSVFDNMLATEEQIEQAKRNREKESSIQILAKKFNLKPEQIDLLQKEKDRADKKASAVILLNKIQGLKNAEEDARKEASEIVRTSDYYNSLSAIRKNGKISFESLLGFLDEETANSIRTKWKDYFSDSENAMSLDDAAVYFNTSAEQFINLLFNEVPAKDYIDQYVQNAKNKFEASYNADAEYMGLDNDVLNLEIELMGGQKIDLKALDTALSERADRKAGEDLDRDYERLKMSIEKKSSMLRDLLNKKEDTATKKEILKLKEQMRIMRADLKANYEKKMERDKTVRAVRKEVKSKSVPEEWRQQILQLVQKVKGLGTPSMTADMNVPSWQEFKDTKFGAEKQDLGVELAAPPIPEWLENLVEPIALSELSTADLKDLRTGIKSLAHIGRTEQTILAGQERKRVQETVNECTENMGKITQTKYLTDREKESFIGGIIDKNRGVVALMTQMRDLFRRADGYTKEGTGPNSKYITQRIHDAQVRELGLTDSFQKEFSSIWQPIAIHSNFTKEFVIEGIQLPKELMRRWGGKFSKDRVIAVALNMGNKGNLDALMKGYGWSMEDLGKIISTLSEEELFAVQKTWDMLERLRPHLEKAYREMNGVDMKLVEAQAITVTSKEGTNITLRGGYYPLQFDPELAQSIGEKEKIDNILNANAFLPTKPTVRKGMTMARTGSKKPPLLSFVSVVSRHLEDSIKYATHAAAVRDVYKIVSNAEYRDSFVSAFGTREYDQIVPWLKACATIDREPTHELKKFAKFLTSRGSLFAMGLSLRTSWMQFTSIGSSIKVDGLGNFMNGCWMFITKPRETARMVKEMSAYMNNRTKIYDKTVADTMRKYNPNATALRVGNHIFTRQQFDSACFALTAMADMAVAVPTWLGKYNAEIKKGLTEQDAIRKADEAVIMAQGSGMTMDTTALMREKGAWEFMLMFMSFAMNWQNRQRFYFAGYKEYLKGNQSEIDHKEFYSHILLEWIMPPVLTVAMLSLQDNEYDMEDAKDDLMNEALSYWLMGVPIVRDIYSGIGYGTKFGETAASKGIELGKQIYKDMEKIHNGKDMNYTMLKHAVNFVGFNLGIPTNSFFRAGEGTYEWLEGDAGIGAIILGKPYKKK